MYITQSTSGTHSHVGSTDQRIRDLGMESGNSDELNGAEIRREKNKVRTGISATAERRSWAYLEKLAPTVQATTRRKYEFDISPEGK